MNREQKIKETATIIYKTLGRNTNEIEQTNIINAIHQRINDCLKSLPPVNLEELKNAWDKRCDYIKNTKSVATDLIFDWFVTNIPAKESEWIFNKLPNTEKQILFQLPNEKIIRLGYFLKKDQFERENMFCDGAFFYPNQVKCWQLAPSAIV